MRVILIILISILTLNSQVMAYEEANYEIVKENKEYEIRKYSDRLVIETNSIQGNGFRKLFNYISGNNEEKKEIKMTVPVTQEVKNGNMTMQFYLPSKFNKENTPKPSNSEIKVLTIEGGYYAVIKYSGRSSDQNFLKNKDILEKVEINDIWGVGRQLTKFYQKNGIYNAKQLKNKSNTWIKKCSNVLSSRTAMELRGVPCIGLETTQTKRKSCVVSRSFGKRIETFQELKEAVANY